MIFTVAFLIMGQVTGISGPTDARRDHLVRLESVGTCDSYIWEVEPIESVDVLGYSDPKFIFTASPGKYVVTVFGVNVVNGKGILSKARTIVTISSGDVPPGPTPDPNPGPDGPNVVPAGDVPVATKQYVQMLLAAFAAGWDRASSDLAAGLTPQVALGNSAQVIAGGRTDALHKTLAPLLEKALPSGTDVKDATQRKQVSDMWKSIAMEIRRYVPR